MFLIYLIISSFLFAYNVGDYISVGHQNQEFDLCYSIPGTMDNVISIGDYNGNTNGGDYNILVIDMSATWCGPCQSLIPLYDQLYQNYSNNEHVEIFVALSDLNQPYSCTQWGNMGTNGIPNIINDTGYPIFNMFGSGGFPSLVLIDHEMKVHYKESGYYSTFVNDISEIIDDMLFNMQNTLILYNETFLTVDDNTGDADSILNPGEEFNIDFIIANNSFDLDALNVTGAIENNDYITFNQNTLSFGDIDLEASSVISVSGVVNNQANLGAYDFNLTILAEYVDLNNVVNEYIVNFPFSVDISLNQTGFPFDTNSEIKSSPGIVDIDNDGEYELVFGDNAGLIHLVDSQGNEIYNNTFPFQTGDQIWGAPAIADIDNDGLTDVVFTSKSKHLYVFDLNGLKLDYNTNHFLIGTPALGNLDDDDDLEIVFGSFSNDANIYAINIDGSSVLGFPLMLDEKMQKGAALYDFNNNGKDDIVFGTEDDNIYLIYDDGTIASGFPYTAGDKIRSAPVVLDIGGEKIIFAGSKDDYLYAINEDGSLRFAFLADDSIYTSPSFLELENDILIFFGSDNGTLYAIDIFGNLHEGFPKTSFTGSIVGSVMFSDINNSGRAEILFGDETGNLNILTATDESYSEFSNYNNFPNDYSYAYASSINIYDIDLDGDVEVFGGTTGDLNIYDIKQNSQENNYWSVYRGDFLRRGTYFFESECTGGDINTDGIVNILDIVRLVNIVINPADLESSEECASDINSDGVINILDIVVLVNIVIAIP